MISCPVVSKRTTLNESSPYSTIPIAEHNKNMKSRLHRTHPEIRRNHDMNVWVFPRGKMLQTLAQPQLHGTTSKHVNAISLVSRGVYDNLHSFAELEQRISNLGP
jgi:hypothetical protein